MPKKFLRRDSSRFSKFGKKRKKMQKWRNPNGRDNKMREQRRGYPKVISVGYKKDKTLRGTLDEKNPVMILNIKDLENLKKNEIAVIGKVGKKKKIEIANFAKEKKIEIYNMNADKFLKENVKVKKVEEKKVEEKKVEETTPQACPDKSSEKISTGGKEKKE